MPSALSPWLMLRALRGRAGQVGRKAVAELGIDELGDLAVEKVGQVRDGVLERVHGEGDVAAVEMAAVQDLSAIGVDDGIVVRTIQLVLDDLPKEGQGVLEDSDDVRRAAKAIPVLKPALVAANGPRLPRSDAQAGGDALLAGMGLHGKKCGVKVLGIAGHGLHGKGADAGAQLR